MKSRVLTLLPLLVVHSLLIVLFSDPGLIGDEIRYIKYAGNLSHGFYTDLSNPELTNGPGYPLLLVPLMALGIPLSAMVWLNIVFLFFGVSYFYKSVRLFVSKNQSILYSYFLGLHPILLKWTGFLYTESLTLFVVCGFMYHFIKASESKEAQTRNFVLGSIYLGILSLTKVFIIYLIVLGFFGCAIYYLLKRYRLSLKMSLVFFGGFLIFLPYLLYCYSVTGKSFYFGTNGGEILYWSSTPYPNEYGEWIGSTYVLGSEEDGEHQTGDYYSLEQLSANHRDFYSQAYSIQNHVERDQFFREKAWENIRSHPMKFAKNTLVGFFRLFFNYPNSYTPQKLTTFFYLVPNFILVAALVLCVFALYRVKGKIPEVIMLLGLFSLFYVAGMMLLVGRVRHLLSVLPMLLLFISYILGRFVKVKLVR